MKKNVIYVDFIFTRKKINYLNFYILYLFSFFGKHFKVIFKAKDKSSELSSQIKKIQ